MKTKEGKKPSALDRQLDRYLQYLQEHARTVNVVIVAVILAASLFIRVNSMVHKEQLHSDEVFSMMLCNANPYYSHPIPDGTYTGEQLKDMIANHGDTGVKGLFHDLGQLWVNNNDAPHASLYYMLLRVALTGYDSYDLHEFIYRGVGLNLVFFLLSFLLMYKLLRRIFGDRMLLVYVGLTLAFCNMFSVANTLLIREYQMAETFVLLLSYVAVGFVAAMRRGEAVDRRRLLAWLSVSVALVVSTGYFNVYFICLLGLMLIVMACRRSRGRDALVVVASGLLGLVIAYVLYPGFFNVVLHKTVHQSMAFNDFYGAMREVFGGKLFRLMFFSYGKWIVLAALLAGILARNRKRLFASDSYMWLPVIALVCMPIINYTSVLKEPRYYFCLTPVLMLLVPGCLSVLSDLWRRYFSILTVSFFIIVACFFTLSPLYGWTQVRADLSRPATIYGLNPNEVVQLIPCMTDNVSYGVLGKDADLTKGMKPGDQKWVVSRTGAWDGNVFYYQGKRLWSKHIYLFLLTYDPQKNNQ